MIPSGSISQADLARFFAQQQQKDAFAGAQFMSGLLAKAQNQKPFAEASQSMTALRGADKKSQNGTLQEMDARRMLLGQEGAFPGAFGLWNAPAERVIKDDSKDAGKDDAKKQLEMISELADQSAARGDYNQAIIFYNKILELNPSTASAWTSLGHCYSMLNDNFSALKAYQQAMNMSEGGTRDEQLWYGIGLLYEKIEDYQNAEVAFKSGLDICTSDALKGELCYHLGYILKAKADYDEAIKVLSNGVLVGKFNTSKSVELLCTIGRCFEEKGIHAEALKMYKHALSLDENNPFTHEFIGWLYFQMDNPTEALKYLQKDSFQELDEEGELHYMIARCYLKLKDYNTAYELFQRCLSKKPLVSFYWSSFGILLAELNQLKQAYEAFNQALKLNPNIAENYFNLGCLFELFGQVNEAMAFYDKASTMSQSLVTVALDRKNRIIRGMSQILPQEMPFKHPDFKLSFLKLQMKEKLDKTFINIRKTDKNAGLNLSPSALSLIQPQPQSQSQSNFMNSGLGQSHQMLLQNQGSAQSLLQQQQQALSKQLLGANSLSQAMFPGSLGLSGLEKDPTLSLLQQRAALNALSMGAGFNPQADLLKKLGAQLGGAQLASQLGPQLGSQFGAQLGQNLGAQLSSQFAGPLASQLNSQLGSQLSSQLGSQLTSQLGAQLGSQFGASSLQSLGLLGPQAGMGLFSGMLPDQQQQLQMQQLLLAQNKQLGGSGFPMMNPLANPMSSISDPKPMEKESKPAVKENLVNQKTLTTQASSETQTPKGNRQPAAVERKASSQETTTQPKTQSQHPAKPQSQPKEEQKTQPQAVKKPQKSLSSVSAANEAEQKQKTLETALSQNEKERMDTIQEKIHNITAESSNKDNNEKTPVSSSQLKPAKSFQLTKDKGNADDLRAAPVKKIKTDAIITKPTEEAANSPSMTTAEKKDEPIESFDEPKEKAADEPSSQAKAASVGKVIKPFVLTPVSEAKQS